MKHVYAGIKLIWLSRCDC